MEPAKNVLVKRLSPGEDLKAVLDALPQTCGIKSGVLVSVVGSLTRACLRMAGAEVASDLIGPFEIVSGTGTVGDAGIHVHIAISDAQGKTIGGHLMDGCLVYTTIELAVLDLSGSWLFERHQDNSTGYPELVPFSISVDSEQH